MKKHGVIGGVLLVVAASLSAAHAAAGDLRLARPFVLNGAVVQPGDYAVELASSLDSVKLIRGKTVVASAPCKLSPVEGAILADAIYSRIDAQGRDEIVRLLMKGTRVAIDMVPSSEAAADGVQGAMGLTRGTR